MFKNIIYHIKEVGRSVLSLATQALNLYIAINATKDFIVSLGSGILYLISRKRKYLIIHDKSKDNSLRAIKSVLIAVTGEIINIIFNLTEIVLEVINGSIKNIKELYKKRISS